jgi:hypothetical protein
MKIPHTQLLHNYLFFKYGILVFLSFLFILLYVHLNNSTHISKETTFNLGNNYLHEVSTNAMNSQGVVQPNQYNNIKIFE